MQGRAVSLAARFMNRVPVLNKSLTLLSALALLFVNTEGTRGAEAIKHRILLCDYPQRIIEVSAEGKLTWEHQTPSVTVMCDVFTNGDILYAYGGAPTGAQR